MARPPLVTLILALALGALPADGQWLKHPTLGIPRTATGQPDLSAPPPRTKDGVPDLSGMWGWTPGRHFGGVAVGLKQEEILPWARTLAMERMNLFGRDDPSNFGCLPQGPRLNLMAPIPAKIVQTPTLILILSEDLTYRQIFLDGRSLPHNPEPSFMGYSVGRWEDDTLVVHTTGFKERTWLDFSGMPHTEALRITERIRRTTFGTLEILETIDDPGVFTTPFTIALGARYIADTELLEYICAENERSRQHIVGTASELFKEIQQKAVAVSPSVLARYVGTYDLRLPENPTTPLLLPIALKNDQLVAGDTPLIPLSDTVFAGPMGQIAFVLDAQGGVDHLLIRAAEGDLKATRVAAPR